MVRELDDVTLTFSLWQQARRELQELERVLEENAARRLSSPELAQLEARLSATRSKAESLLTQALDVLREYSKNGASGV